MVKFITIGKIIKPYGVKGELIIKNESRWYEPFDKLTKIICENSKNKMELEIDTIRDFNDRIAVKFKGIDNPEDASKYRNMELKVPSSEMPVLQEDEFYGFDLLGFRVFDTEKKEHGEVIDIVNLPANDAIIIKTASGNELMIPAVKAIIRDIDFENKRVIINSIEGFEE